MSESIMVDYAFAEAWRQRSEAATKADKLAKLSVKAALTATKMSGVPQLAEKARLAREAAAQAAKEAEKVWADSAETLRGR